AAYSTCKSQTPLKSATGCLGGSGIFAARRVESTEYKRSATILSSPGERLNAVIEMPFWFPRELPTKIRGSVVLRMLDTCGPVMPSLAASQRTFSPGLLLDSPVGSRTSVLTPSIDEAFFAI